MLTIRRFQKGDEEILSVMIRRTLREVNYTSPKSELDYLIPHYSPETMVELSETGHTYVLEEDGQIVGSGTVLPDGETEAEIVAAFLIALVMRVAQGSATVALTTAAGFLAPAVHATPGLSPAQICLLVLAVAAGATALSHVNDSGFWLIGRLLGMDVPTTLRTWTVLETLVGVVGFAITCLLWVVL